MFWLSTNVYEILADISGNALQDVNDVSGAANQVREFNETDNKATAKNIRLF